MSSKKKSTTSDPRLVVKRSHSGLGMFAKEPIKKGSFIIEYVGKRIPTKVADTLPGRYFFEIDSTWTIDGSTRTNTARYINHSCDPNCEAEIDEHDRILISAIKNIAKDEELSFDYGEEYFEEFLKEDCRCGTAKCRALLNKKKAST